MELPVYTTYLRAHRVRAARRVAAARRRPRPRRHAGQASRRARRRSVLGPGHPLRPRGGRVLPRDLRPPHRGVAPEDRRRRPDVRPEGRRADPAAVPRASWPIPTLAEARHDRAGRRLCSSTTRASARGGWTVVKSGVLTEFLLSRSPLPRFPRSNGHGRGQPGLRPISRQSNLIVESSAGVPFAQLVERLKDEARKAGKPFGLLFDHVEGGFTFTGRYVPNAFNVTPIIVYRVYTDGRPMELVRGVDLIGTPLSAFAKIVATDNRTDTFNGICGAESGPVPVSASSPALLVSEVEVQKKPKSQDSLPILPAPAARTSDGDDPLVLRAMTEELTRSLSGLKMDDEPPPYFASYTVTDVAESGFLATLGAHRRSAGGARTRAPQRRPRRRLPVRQLALLRQRHRRGHGLVRAAADRRRRGRDPPADLAEHGRRRTRRPCRCSRGRRRRSRTATTRIRSPTSPEKRPSCTSSRADLPASAPAAWERDVQGDLRGARGARGVLVGGLARPDCRTPLFRQQRRVPHRGPDAGRRLPRGHHAAGRRRHADSRHADHCREAGCAAAEGRLAGSHQVAPRRLARHASGGRRRRLQRAGAAGARRRGDAHRPVVRAALPRAARLGFRRWPGRRAQRRDALPDAHREPRAAGVVHGAGHAVADRVRGAAGRRRLRGGRRGSEGTGRDARAGRPAQDPADDSHAAQEPPAVERARARGRRRRRACSGSKAPRRCPRPN